MAEKTTAKKTQKVSDFIKQVQKRNGSLEDFDLNRIADAIYKAMIASDEGSDMEASMVANKVLADLIRISKKHKNFIPTVEGLQDTVEKELILSEYVNTAKNYILYRSKRSELREKGIKVPEKVKKLAEESKKYFRNPLAEFIYYRSYSKWIDSESRRETWIETVDRYMDFMKENLGKKISAKDQKELREAILNQEVMPSMRLMWSAGPAARNTNVCGYNCSFIALSELQDFGEIMYISMCGTGVGFSVESHHVEALPQIKKQTGKKLKTYVVADNKEGWADAFVFGMKTWFNGKDIDFDYSKLRPMGAKLKTMGGKSSGPEPLMNLMRFTKEKILSRQGRRLTTLDAHDIICKIGEIVVSGGVRRSALISLSDLDDQQMRDAKKGQFYLNEPQRSMANNSAVYDEKPTTTEFLDEWLALMKSGSGERGIFNRGALENQVPKRRWKILAKDIDKTGTNPCITGETLVYVADGRGNVPIKQLADEGKDVPVFTRTDEGGVAVRMMRNPRITGYGAEVYEVTLDDGSTIKVTKNHKFLTRDGGYKEVKDLKYGDALSVLTRFEASIKDIFKDNNSRSQDYWWLVKSGNFGARLEHRYIAEFHHNKDIKKGEVVHHLDFKGQNNAPENLKIMTKKEHDELHGKLMVGDNNPMRRAKTEWSEDKRTAYKKIHSENNSSENNYRYSGITDEELRKHSLLLTKKIGHRFSNANWLEYAKKNGLPQSFSKWRKDHLGGILGLAKWAACELGMGNIDADPRIVDSYRKLSKDGYNCEIIEGALYVVKNCEGCGVEFRVLSSHREAGCCSLSCGVKNKWKDEEFRKSNVEKINRAHESRRVKLRETQAKIYSDLAFRLGRTPLKKEWVAECKEKDISPEISRSSSPFRTYTELQDAATMVNHKVVSVKSVGYENVYNGTVDEFHNFFVGGFPGTNKFGKNKNTYLNNRQCGEIILKSKQFCNLTEVVSRADDTEKTLLRKARLASILGTYQSTLTNFGYLSEEWKKNCEEERLLGVSITGQWDSKFVRDEKILKKMKNEAIKTNEEYAKKFGVNTSTSITCVKPSGTVSQLVDAASGMHPRYSKYYIRRIRISVTDALFQMLKDQGVPFHPEVGQSEENANTYVLEFPVKAPDNAIVGKDVSAMDQLEHWKKVKKNFTEHNPSVTISVGESEWINTAHWLYDNWDILGGLSFLPRSNHVYKLAPYEEIDEATYKELRKRFTDIDFSKIVTYEVDDDTKGSKELACVSGTCEI